MTVARLVLASLIMYADSAGRYLRTVERGSSLVVRRHPVSAIHLVRGRPAPANHLRAMRRSAVLGLAHTRYNGTDEGVLMLGAMA